MNCLDPDLPRLALFSVRDIKKGEELTFDYNSGLGSQQMANGNSDQGKGELYSVFLSIFLLMAAKGIHKNKQKLHMSLFEFDFSEWLCQ